MEVNKELEEMIYNVSYIPQETLTLADQNHQLISFQNVAALGGAFGEAIPKYKEFASKTKKVLGAKGQPGIYKVSFPEGVSGNLKKLKDGSGRFGAIYSSDNKLVGQARLNEVNALNMPPVPVDPATIAILAIVIDIEHKLNDIAEAQKRILAFLDEDKKAQLKGNYINLTEILKNYKFNYNNELYIKNQSVIVLDIKKHALQNIEFYKKQIEGLLKEKTPHNAQGMEARAKAITSQLDNYQSALYNYAFATYVDVLLLENFTGAYLDSVKGGIQELCNDYRMIYTQCDKLIAQQAADTINNNVLKGLADVNSAAGHIIGKIPLVKKGPVDEALVAAGDKLHKVRNQTKKSVSDHIRQQRHIYAASFITHIDTIKNYFNNPIELTFDEDSISINAVVS